MVAIAAAFLAGVCLFQFQTAVPSAGWLAAVPPLVLAAWRWRRARLPVAVAGGFLWTLAWLVCFGPAAYQADWDARDLQAEGVVASLPEQRGEAVRLELRVHVLRSGKRILPVPGRVRLSWRLQKDAAAPRLGERWRLQIRLKPPRGFANPGGFDYEAWLLRAGIAATGYVVADGDNVRLSEPAGLWRLAALREQLRDQLAGDAPVPRARAVLAALAVGDRGGFDRALWELFRRTGTTHLMSISGLHVSLVSGLVYALVAWLWRRGGRLALRLPAQHAGAWGALAAALAYSALAGFSVPTQRSLLMGTVVLGAVLLRRAQRPAQVLALALLAVLLADPLAVLAVDFWLSFGAVAAILLAALGRRPRRWRDRLGAWTRVQLAITLALAPLTLFLFQQVSLVAPVANAWAIPWFGLVVVPFALLVTAVGTAAPVSAGLLVHWIAALAEWGLRGLEVMADLPLAEVFAPTPPPPAVAAAVFGAVLIALPRGLPARSLGLVLWLPLLWNAPPPVPPGHLRLTLLDVGQGMAAVLRTERHVLVYDLGPRLSAQFDATSAVVVPFLRHAGVARVDALVLSNGDADHAGVPAALLRAVPVAAAYSGEPPRIADLATRHCHAGQEWQWDGVHFRFLNPADPALAGNDASCVLQAQAGGASLLLTGDIGAAVERRLLARFGDTLRADAVQVAHHGSRTSSDSGFVAAVQPRLALFSTGYRNRFGFPKPDVVERWRARGAEVLDTQRAGAITLELGPAGVTGGPRRERSARRRYWHAD